MEFDSHSRNSSSCSVGTRPFGFIARYAGSLFLPNGPPISMRSCGRPSSPTAHITFCTLTEVFRPQILIMVFSPRRSSSPGSTRRSILFRKTMNARVKPGHDGWRRARPWSIQPARFLRKHDRDAGADRIGELSRARDQLLLLGIVFQRTLGQRADQDFEELGVDIAGGTFGG